jgi:hypothetical protein
MLLTTLMALPLVGALIVFTLPIGRELLAKQISLIVATSTAIGAIFLGLNMDKAKGGLQFTESYEWIPAFGISWSVGVDGISEHRIISGEFNCYFGTGYKLPMDDNFTKWLEERGVDPKDEQLALGYAPVGKIVDMPYTEAVDFFKEYTDFYSIEFNKKRIEYDYRHTDPGYFPMLERMWSKWNG